MSMVVDLSLASTASEVRLALLHEGARPFACVARAHDLARALVLDRECVLERAALAPDHGFLDLSDRERTVLGDPRGELERAIEKLLARHDLVQEAHLERSRRRNRVAR